ncbi:MAG: type I restriction enzyme HsdR N-terminal domain-containing protein [Bacteroidales bacterium]|nr:type I restriction enzyme HsdR N-terminal domain-containing protein [Bacteroidales bacterium]MDE6238042.1 type I restriction enzyme HsdR N-terminal domain-containing protein [Muribaculaceae bacterium]MDE6538059.1 type I restriction enzyme HsdR N-terminal domain-containing protein [Muribaculaceae bacterium]
MEKDNKKYPSLNLPPVALRMKVEDGLPKVFDPFREKYVAFTPEENVRQHFAAWLRDNYHYPASLMANEIGIEVNGMRKRCDTVVFNRAGEPLMIVEYKAPDVNVTQEVFDQIVRYNMTLKARYLVVSNGMEHYCCVIDYRHGTYNFIPTIPDYRDIGLDYSEN